MSTSYLKPKAPANAEYIIKKSRFIGLAYPVQSRQDAMTQLQQTKVVYPDARHYCWAYLLGHPTLSASAAMSDDGEPSGTAGKPILNVIQHKAISDLLIVVVRYFGGIKLGAGGLTRAYGQAAQLVIQELDTILWQDQTVLTLSIMFKQEQAARHQIKQLQGSIIEVLYEQNVLIKINIAKDQVQHLSDYAAANHMQIFIEKP